MPEMTDFTIERAAGRTAEERAAVLADPGFGSNFSDHMTLIDWTAADSAGFSIADIG